MAEHHVSVTVRAPVQQVYALFTHFNDFPKFMRFVKEVTYYDDQRSHWVVQVGGRHEWDAVNEGWIPDQQIGWRSIDGLQNTGRVKFTPVGTAQTMVDVFLNYTPPAGVLGAAIEKLGMDSHFQSVLEEDMQHFAHMVEEAPPGALDPMSSHYLFHEGSAVARGEATSRQEESMAHDPMMAEERLRERDTTIAQQQAASYSEEQRRQAEEQARLQHVERASAEQEAVLREQDRRNRQEAAARREQEAAMEKPREPHPVYDTLGGRNAAMANTPFGDQDARGERFPQHNQDPMKARATYEDASMTRTPVEGEEAASPWESQIHGRPFDVEEEGQRPLEEDKTPRQQEQRDPNE